MSAFVVIVGEGHGDVAQQVLRPEEGWARHGTTVIELEGASLAHAALVDGDGERSRQCLTRGALTVMADARIDEPVAASDAEAILDAYEKWGDGCAAHLTGDFAFVIWDARLRSLFAARDFLGIRPLFYARTKSALIVASSVRILLRHPEIESELNPEQVAIFLAGAEEALEEETIIRGVFRLRPAHSLIARPGTLNVRRYWDVPGGTEIAHRLPHEFVDEFLELLERAVSDRVRGAAVAVTMSGGLDSTAVAATARAVRPGLRIAAYTISYAHRFHDEEEIFAATVARSLGIEHHVLEGDDRLFLHRSTYARGEPYTDPQSGQSLAVLEEAARSAPTMLSGLGGDSVLRGSRDYFRDLVRSRQFYRLVVEIVRSAVILRAMPPLNFRSWVAGRSPLQRQPAAPPSWIRHELVGKFRLRERLASAAHETRGKTLRPDAARVAEDPVWLRHLESLAAASTGLPIHCAHPILDKRLFERLLFYPPIPWFVDKRLMRVAMKGKLPDAVRLRAKTPLSGYSSGEAMAAQVREAERILAATPSVGEFVDPLAVVAALTDGSGDDRVLLAVSLARWMQNCTTGEELIIDR